jgi:type IV fimbrial biogenesis protein FimT
MHTSRGFTLVEMLAVLAVAGTLFMLGAPSLAAVLRVTRVSSASNEFLASLLLTRSEAMKRKHRVVMCRSADAQGCAAAGGWQQGWIVFADADGDGERAAGEPVLYVQPALGTTMRLTGTATVAKYVSYAPNGTTKLVGGGFQAGTLTVCSASGEKGTGRQVIVNATGRPRTQKVELPSCG